MIVFKYGLKDPTLNEQIVKTQLRLAHQYRNKLIEIERQRRKLLRDAYSSVGDIPTLETEAKQASENVRKTLAELKSHKASTRTRKVPPELAQKLEQAKQAKRDANSKLRTARVSAKCPSLQRRFDEINDWASGEVRTARKISGLYWGNYQIVEAAMDASKKLPLYDGTEPQDPSFVRWRGEGTVAVQIQNGMDVHEAFGNGTRVQIETAGRYHILRMRVGSTDTRKPIWAEWPMKMHRPLPSGRIKWVKVNFRKYGSKRSWSVDFTIDNDPIIRACGDGEVAVNLGWRDRGPENGIRVGYAMDMRSGEAWECLVPPDILNALSYQQHLRSIRDRSFEEIKARLKHWLASADGRFAPKWFVEDLKHMSLWRAQTRLVRVHRKWAAERWKGDKDIFQIVDAWQKQDHHLWTWESNQRIKSIRRRNDFFANWAYQLCSRYTVVVLNEHDMSETARRPTPEKQAGDIPQARYNRQLVGPSMLRQAIVNVKRTTAGAAMAIPQENLTLECHNCGSIEESLDRRMLVHHCAQCDAEWDIDHNCCLNIRARFTAKPGESKLLASPGNGNFESRWARVSEMTEEKRSRQAATLTAD